MKHSLSSETPHLERQWNGQYKQGLIQKGVNIV